MDTNPEDPRMMPADFASALLELEWKQSDFCRKTGVDKNTPSRWVNSVVPIPKWVPAYLGAMLEIKRLHVSFVRP